MAYESNLATNAGLIEIQIEYRAVAELNLDSRNPRQHSQRQVNQLADSIREFGFVMPVVADGRGQESSAMDGFWQQKNSRCRAYPLSRSGISRRHN
jgi:hypothetical protein